MVGPSNFHNFSRTPLAIALETLVSNAFLPKKQYFTARVGIYILLIKLSTFNKAVCITLHKLLLWTPWISKTATATTISSP